jgi:chromatin remodeling complex protein RSC6
MTDIENTELSHNQEILPIDIINTHFKSLQHNLLLISKTTKTLGDELKNIQKTLRQSDKQSKQKKKTPQVKLNLSSELTKFLSVDNDIKLTKADVMKQISSYIKTKDLQIKEDKRRFKPNKELSKIFGLKATKSTPLPNLTFVEINKYVSQHLSK